MKRDHWGGTNRGSKGSRQTNKREFSQSRTSTSGEETVKENRKCIWASNQGKSVTDEKIITRKKEGELGRKRDEGREKKRKKRGKGRNNLLR